MWKVISGLADMGQRDWYDAVMSRAWVRRGEYRDVDRNSGETLDATGGRLGEKGLRINLDGYFCEKLLYTLVQVFTPTVVAKLK